MPHQRQYPKTGHRNPCHGIFSPEETADFGFSLAESMIVICIVGILSSLAFANYQQRVDRELLNRISQQLQTWLEDRRSQAMTSVEAMGTGACIIEVASNNVQLDASQAQPTIQQSFGASTVRNLCQDPALFKLRKVEGAPNNSINLTTNPPGVDKIIYSFRGTTSSSTEFKILKDKHPTAYCIKIIKPLGIIRRGLANPSGADCDYRKPYADIN